MPQASAKTGALKGGAQRRPGNSPPDTKPYIENLVNPDSRPPARPGLKVDESFAFRPGRRELPQASVRPAGPGLQ
eukprot:3540044-Alexandrium_andersonii.AAC.1